MQTLNKWRLKRIFTVFTVLPKNFDYDWKMLSLCWPSWDKILCRMNYAFET